MRFFTLSALILAQRAYYAAAQGSYDLELGYLATLIPDLPGTEPNVGCGLWTELHVDTETLQMDGKTPTDGCPAADKSPFCNRWGCPFTMTFGNGRVTITVSSSNEADNSFKFSVQGPQGSTEVECPESGRTVRKDRSFAIYRTNRCFFGLG